MPVIPSMYETKKANPPDSRIGWAPYFEGVTSLRGSNVIPTQSQWQWFAPELMQPKIFALVGGTPARQ